MAQELTTGRLALRSFVANDAERLATLLNDFTVVKWLTHVPFPYSLQDAGTFIDRVSKAEPHTYAVEHDGQLVGSVGVSAQLGYWIAKNCHGQGFATEAATAVISDYFARGESILKSSYHAGNHASRAVQAKLGFRPVGAARSFVVSRNDEVETHLTELSLADWEAQG